MGKSLKVAVIGGGMFFEDIIGQSLKDFARSGFAGALTSIAQSAWAPKVADIAVQTVAIGTHSAKRGTAGKLVEWWKTDMPEATAPKACYGEKVWEQIVGEYKPDILFVATPDHLHYDPIVYALQHGIHVITEKPMCLKTAEADKIIALAAAKGLIVAVDMHKRYDPFVRELMTNSVPKYDTIYRVRAVLEEPLEASSEIFAWAEHSNPFAYVGCHWLDVVGHYLNVLPQAVYATGEKNLLINWDKYVKIIAQRQGKPLSKFARHEPIKTWDSMNVNVTYTNGMRGDFNNAWINPYEFEGNVNQDIEVQGILGRGFVDQQERGFREAICGVGSKTRNPTFGGRIRGTSSPSAPVEVFGYGKASIIAGMLAISRAKFFGEDPATLAGSYPEAASQRSITMIIDAATTVAERNYTYSQQCKGAPVSARLDDNSITLLDPYKPQAEETLYRRA